MLIKNSGEKFLIFIILPIASGILTSLSFEKFSLFFFSWFSVSLLFISIFRKKRLSFFSGFLYGFSYYLISLYWIPSVMFKYGNLSKVLSSIFFLALILLLSLFWAIFSAAISIFIKISTNFMILSPFLWISIEYIMSFIFTGFPWNLIGYSQVDFIPLIQISSVTGVYGISFLIILFNASITLLLITKKKWYVLITILLIFFTILYGIATTSFNYRTNGLFKVSVIQGNINQDIIWDSKNLIEKFNEHMELSEASSKNHAKLIVWPEFSVPIYIRYNSFFKKIMIDFAKNRNVSFLAGFTDIRYENNSNNFYNSSFLISKDGVESVYDKIHLVPFGEYVPLRKFLGFFESITKEIGDFTPGKNSILHKVNGNKFGTPVCYEIIFPDLVRRFVKKGAVFIVTITNDAWFGKTSAPYQHFAMARMRAVENRRFLIRAASTGISGIVDPFGKIVKLIDLEKKGYAVSEIYPISYLSFYTRYGDVFAHFCILISLFAFIFFIILRKQVKFR
ncbi:MAG: apolipoprotein N-acyltransferase [Acidobacteriota bacterium]